MAHSTPTKPFLPPKPVKIASVKNKCALLTNSVTPVGSSPVIKTGETPTVKSSSTSSTKPMHSTAFLSRIFGSKSRGDFDSYGAENPSVKRRRRPVSAVFSQAFHRLSTTSIYNKRVFCSLFELIMFFLWFYCCFFKR